MNRRSFLGSMAALPCFGVAMAESPKPFCPRPLARALRYRIIKERPKSIYLHPDDWKALEKELATCEVIVIDRKGPEIPPSAKINYDGVNIFVVAKAPRIVPC